ncbi:MAG: glycosyltransferase family 2 protein, partial [Dehalococcoidia bacterium]|nr:glycosyltransferase family 2 protein [Dehalococcoidia bacterium]
VNNDVWLESRWLEEMLRSAELGDRVGMVATKILLAVAPDRLDSGGIALDRAGFAWNLDRGQFDAGEAEPREVFGPCAAAALYRRDMLDEIGLFDEDFFAFLEDADLAWRARLADWRCVFTPAARAYHIHSATAGQGSSFKAYLLARNRLWTILKDYPTPQLLLALPAIAAYDLIALLVNLAAGRGRASLKGRIDAVKGMGKAWDKRRQVQALRRPDSRWEAHLCPLVSPWEKWSAERKLAAIVPPPTSRGLPTSGP